MKKLLLAFCVLFSVLGNAQTWTKYTTTDGLAGNLIFSIAIDAQGNKWFATSKGVSKFDGNNWTTYNKENGLIDNSVYAVAIDALGNKWFGTSFGISKFDGYNWTNTNQINGTALYYFRALYVDNNNNLWAGLASDGALKYDGLSWSFVKRFFDADQIFLDTENNLWFTSSSEGVRKYDGSKWTSIQNVYGNKNSLASDAVYSGCLDLENNKWFGTYKGISKFDGKNWKTFSSLSHGLLSDNVKAIAIDSKGTKWIGTDRGLSNLKDSVITNFTGSSGQISLEFSVTCIVIDNDGTKWIATTDGLFSFKEPGAIGSIKIFKEVHGCLFHDLNSNGKKDPNETNISGQIVKINNNYTTTQNNGLFYTSLNKGTHTFTYRPQANWKLTTDSSITVTITDAPIKDTLYFGVQAIANKHEIETKLTGTATRAGFESKSWINYTNVGTLVETGTVSYTLADEASLVQSIPVADSAIGKRLVWKYSNLIPNEQRQISVTTQMPGVNYLGDTLVSISKIKSDSPEYSDTLKQVLTGSYDPNDKLVNQAIGSKGYVLLGKELEYTVRFQNTGTDTAFNVNIRDTLDMNFDVASLQIVASSHPVKLDLRGQNEATFRFENILLPDSNVNQLGSNGFVKYTIRPKKNLVENTSVKNKAYIYFDFNPAILTNETENTYVSILPSVVTGIQGFQSNKSANIFPNPTKDEFTIVFPQTGPYEISLANIQGKSIKTWNEIVGQETTLSVEGVEPGMYLYTAQGRNGQKYMGKLVIGR